MGGNNGQRNLWNAEPQRARATGIVSASASHESRKEKFSLQGALLLPLTYSAGANAPFGLPSRSASGARITRPQGERRDGTCLKARQTKREGCGARFLKI